MLLQQKITDKYIISFLLRLGKLHTLSKTQLIVNRNNLLFNVNKHTCACFFKQSHGV